MPLNQLHSWLNAVVFGLLLLLLHVQGQDSSEASPIRNTHSGQVRGSLVEVNDAKVGVHRFLGIPFAKPPVGPLRFAPPEAPEPWSGVRDGTSHSAICLQSLEMMNSEGLMDMKLPLPGLSMSEDCLYLNIYTPAHANEGSNLPVMVWIHGGALVGGMASMTDGSILAATEDVVVVTIQYRVGVLGFFSTGDQHARGNWGFLDQVAALRWVQQNIAHFGGNPDLVTIFGESAGGTSVSSLVVSPMSKGLFHRAIMESGVALLPDLISDTHESVYTTVAKLSGCETMDSEALVRCLRGKSEAEILVINEVFKVIPAVVDGVFLPKHPQELLASVNFRPVPSIIGVNNDEYGWILPMIFGSAQTIKEITRENLQAVLKNTAAQMMLPLECSDLIMEEYMGDTEDPQTLQIQYTEMMGDFMFVIPALQVAHFQRSHAPVYFYEFQHQPSYIKSIRPPYVKADHGDELTFVFGSFIFGMKLDLTEEEELLNRRMMKYWANFARHGNPNSEDLPFWPMMDHDEQYLQLNIHPAVGRALKARRLQFWTQTLPQKIQELKKSQSQDSSEASPIRSTHTGQVRGSLVQVTDAKLGVHSFLGIPFAKPPVGPLRFARPEAPEPWSGVRDGTSHPAMCLQNLEMMNSEGLTDMKLTLPPISMSEDCLYLNIYTPAHAREGSNLPVMVWIHGGALVSGMASMYDGSTLAATENVVVVTIQYRLGVLGFFSTGDQHARGNWGYLDQVAALRWVQQNIAHFGGNPDLVTIFGESAGGTSVSSLVVSPMSKGLFHRAIMESGVALLPDLISETHERVYTTVANLSGCETMDSEGLVRCLRGKSEAEILLITKVFKMIPAVVDGVFLPRHPRELLASVGFHPVPSIIGVNNDEYGLIIPMVMGSAKTIKEITRENLQAVLKNTTEQMMLPPECSDLIMKEYMGDTEDPQTLQIQYMEMMGDFMFVIPALQVAHFQRSHAPVYFYEFQHQPSFVKDVRPPHVKADHGDEVLFVFGAFSFGMKLDLTEEEELLNRRMMKYWANFARHGNPNSGGLPYWPMMDDDEQYLQLDIQPAEGRALKARRLQFWTQTLPQKIQELQGRDKHTEL